MRLFDWIPGYQLQGALTLQACGAAVGIDDEVIWDRRYPRDWRGKGLWSMSAHTAGGPWTDSAPTVPAVNGVGTSFPCLEPCFGIEQFMLEKALPQMFSP